MTLSWAAENWPCPIRFAGTWKQYSTKAMSQLTVIAIHNGELLYLRWPYHAIVMKMLETVSNIIVFIYYIFPFLNMGFKILSNSYR